MNNYFLLSTLSKSCIGVLFILFINSCGHVSTEGHIKSKRVTKPYPVIVLPSKHKDTIFIGSTLQDVKTKYRDTLYFTREEFIDQRYKATHRYSEYLNIDIEEAFVIDYDTLTEYYITIHNKDSTIISVADVLKKYPILNSYNIKNQNSISRHLRINHSMIDNRVQIEISLAITSLDIR